MHHYGCFSLVSTVSGTNESKAVVFFYVFLAIKGSDLHPISACRRTIEDSPLAISETYGQQGNTAGWLGIGASSTLFAGAAWIEILDPVYLAKFVHRQERFLTHSTEWIGGDRCEVDMNFLGKTSTRGCRRFMGCM